MENCQEFFGCKIISEGSMGSTAKGEGVLVHLNVIIGGGRRRIVQSFSASQRYLRLVAALFAAVMIFTQWSKFAQLAEV